MAGPTPVSALIHAATMVTAGVYMIARLNFLFDMAPDTLGVIAVVGTATAFFAATIGVAQWDIKKVLAYSTVSQLGFMFIAMGVGAYAQGIFHLFTHAFFKACLFLGSGSIIHALHHEQDMRNMGGLKKYMPITFWTFMISTLALSGIPPFAGFFSKDEILWKAWSSPHGSGLIWFFGSLAAGLTAFYMFRQVFMTFYGEYRGPGHAGEDEHAAGHDDEHGHGEGHGLHEPQESSLVMTIPLMILAAGALLTGFLNVPGALGGHHVFDTWLEPVMVGSQGAAAHGAAVHAVGAAHGVAAELAADVEHVAHEVAHDPFEYILMGVSVLVAFAGIFLAWLMYRRQTIAPERFSETLAGVPYHVVYNKYFIDEIYQATIVRGTMALSSLLANFDRIVIDGVVNGVARVTRLVATVEGAFDHYVVDGAVNAIGAVSLWVGNRVRTIQTGHIYSYLYAIAIGVAVVLFVQLI